MLLIFHQFMKWVNAHLRLSSSPKRVSPQTQCVVNRPVIGWDVGHEHMYELYGAERYVWEACDSLAQDPPSIEVSIVQEVVEETWEWDWEESSDHSWVKLMYHFAVVEDPEMY